MAQAMLSAITVTPQVGWYIAAVLLAVGLTLAIIPEKKTLAAP